MNLNKFLPAFSGFLRRETRYVLLALLTLTAFVIVWQYSEPAAPDNSPAVAALEKKTEAFQIDVYNPQAWLHLFQAHPAACLSGCFFMLAFIGLFSGGIVFAIGLALVPRLKQWFDNHAPPASDWDGVILFRVVTAVAAVMVSSGIFMQLIWNEESGENTLAILHTLFTDLTACFLICKILSDAGYDWRFLFAKPVQGIGAEIKRGLAAYAAAFPIFVAVLILILLGAALLHIEPPEHPLVKIFVEEEARAPVIFYLALALATIAAPIMEEIFFRGFLYRFLRGKASFPVAATVTALCFASVHGSGFAFAPIFVLGFVLSALYEKRGSLIACWTFHITHNILFTGYFLSLKAIIGS